MDMDQQAKHWIKRIQQSGHKKSANALISHYFDEIYGYAFKQVGNEETAIEVTQEIFVSMLQSIDRYDQSKSSFRTWIYHIAKRRIVDYYRSKDYQEDRLINLDDELVNQLRISCSEEAQNAAELREVSDFVGGLDSRSREIFKLRAFEGFTFDGISKMIEVPESTVKANFYATQKLVREEFECNA